MKTVTFVGAKGRAKGAILENDVKQQGIHNFCSERGVFIVNFQMGYLIVPARLCLVVEELN